MRFPYMLGKAKTPQPSLGGGVLRPRPIVAVRVFGPTGDWLVDGHLDTGADDTIFPDGLAAATGVDLSRATPRLDGPADLETGKRRWRQRHKGQGGVSQ